MIRRIGIALSLTLALTAGGAQGVERLGAAQQPPPQGPARGRAGAVPGAPLVVLRRKLAERAQRELSLSPDQMRKLQQVDRDFEGRQRQIDLAENQTRRALRAAMLESASPDQERRVGALLEELLRAPRQRLETIDAEQRALGAFLTNTQRARWHALQENFRRQMQDVIAGTPPDSAAAARGGRPPRS